MGGATSVTRLHGSSRHGTGPRRLLVACALGALLVVPGCATLGFHRQPAPLRIGRIVQMSRQGVPPEKIIEQMRKSGTVYRLSSAQIVDLHERGVPYSVLDYMQQAYVQSVRNQQRLQDWGMWTQADDGYWYGGVPFGWPDGWIVYPRRHGH